MVKVSVVKCNSYNEELVYKKIKEALNLINFNDIKKGDKVLLKPNVVCPKEPDKAATTHPSIINALCKILKEKKVDIWIGESSGSVMYGGTKKSFDVAGITEVAKKWNAKLIIFDTSKIITKKINSTILNEIHIPEQILKADYVINLPKLKTHRLTLYSGAIKNLFGCIPGGRKQNYHKIAITEKKFGDLLIDIYKEIPVNLTIMDAIIGMEGDGPTVGDIKYTGLILASKNVLALDMVAAKIIGFRQNEISYITAAIKRNLNPEIDIVGEKNILINYKKPNELYRWLPNFIRNSLDYQLIPRVKINQEKCKKCLICVNSCPQKTIKFEKEVKINQKNCIKCYCCYELCPERAIDLKDTPILKSIKFIFRKFKS